MTVHHETVPGYAGTLTQLADDIGNLRYDALARFLASLQVKLATDANADERGGRTKLAQSLRTSAERIDDAAKAIAEAWEIAAPHMK